MIREQTLPPPHPHCLLSPLQSTSVHAPVSTFLKNTTRGAKALIGYLLRLRLSCRKCGAAPACLLQGRSQVSGGTRPSPPGLCSGEDREAAQAPGAREQVCLSFSLGLYLGPGCGLAPTGPSDLPRNLLVLRCVVGGRASSLFSSELEPREAAESAPCPPSSQGRWGPWHSGLPDDLRLWLKKADAMHSAAVCSQAQSSFSHRLWPTPARREQEQPEPRQHGAGAPSGLRPLLSL